MNLNELYKELMIKEVFSYNDALMILKDNDKTSVYLNRLLKKDMIKKVKKNLYVVNDLIYKEPIGSKFLIGTKINDFSFISYHSAFEFYGFYNQVFNNVNVSSLKPFNDFTFNNESFEFIKTNNNIQVDIIKGVKVTSIERTIIDSINKIGIVIDVEELIKCLNLIHFVNENKLKEMLLIYNKDVLFRKTGYILSYFKDNLRLSDDFFLFCKEHSNTLNTSKISSNEINDLEYIKEWGLYAYKDLFKLISKGEEIDV